ncbi:NTP transferase domain-containing protein [Terrilactibacillus sp. BCM23-1]|uniref:NTP transferase domain-containing protein n=1 Tax=Terrilactibacillus tamarindi TaxID=2599694 RepID=A0A6N8CMP3_9BACI|nr:sugar phosphate nucleotidyltransferase [Terrilactibacillus tamarindi]MTT30898.1 NTP transferase domain-containing protein [Terrilactibacillus tamarindi]
MKVVIMAGGMGTRFWPWSVKDRPKQFLPLISEETMLQQTYQRFQNWLPLDKIYIVTSKEYVPLVEDQLPNLYKSQMIVEPLSRDTGPCLALTALRLLEENDEPFAAVPADHYIPEESSLPKLFQLAEEVAEKGRSIVTLGIEPTRPEPGYGYLQVEEGDYQSKVLPVKKFIEKPNKKKARELLKSNRVYWNSGIFIWKPSTIIYYMKKFQPKMWQILSHHMDDLEQAYSKIRKTSIDYAILEKAASVYTIPSHFKWDDVGNWSAWERHHQKSELGNVVSGDVYLQSTKNCSIKSEKQKTIVIGVEDLIIASTDEGLLICHKSQEQKIKEIIKEMSKGKEDQSE